MSASEKILFSVLAFVVGGLASLVFYSGLFMEDGESTVAIEKGRSKNKGPFQYGHLEASYEIDSLNLLSLGVNMT